MTRPDPDFNSQVVGILSKALERYAVKLHGFTLMPDGYVALATYDDPESMAGFHCYLNTNLSKVVSRLRGPCDVVFPRRYEAVELSDEPAVALERLRRLLALPVDQNWVSTPLDWPGVSCARSLMTGEPLRGGRWTDRTAYHRAVASGADVTLEDFTEDREVYFEPLPSADHLSTSVYGRRVESLVREISAEARRRHRRDDTVPRGLAAIAALDSESRSATERSVRRPWFYVLDEDLKEALRVLLLGVMAQYAAAAAELKRGNRHARFPLHTFPPTLGFVRNVELLEPG